MDVNNSHIAPTTSGVDINGSPIITASAPLTNLTNGNYNFKIQVNNINNESLSVNPIYKEIQVISSIPIITITNLFDNYNVYENTLQIEYTLNNKPSNSILELYTKLDSSNYVLDPSNTNINTSPITVNGLVDGSYNFMLQLVILKQMIRLLYLLYLSKR